MGNISLDSSSAALENPRMLSTTLSDAIYTLKNLNCKMPSTKICLAFHMDGFSFISIGDFILLIYILIFIYSASVKADECIIVYILALEFKCRKCKSFDPFKCKYRDKEILSRERRLWTCLLCIRRKKTKKVVISSHTKSREYKRANTDSITFLTGYYIKGSSNVRQGNRYRL